MRVRPSKVQARTFELLGAEPKAMDLSEFIEAVKAGSVDAQENAFANTVTYGVHKFHRFHSATNQCYVSRPVFVHRPSFDAWPQRVQEEMRAAAQDAVIFQRQLHVKEEDGRHPDGRRRDPGADSAGARGVRPRRQPHLRRGAERIRTRSPWFGGPVSDKARSSEEPYSPDLSCYIPANFYGKNQPQHFGQHCSASCCITTQHSFSHTVSLLY